MGIQDFNENVQKAVNRRQPFESVDRVHGLCREAGFDSINFDLIYGLPLQTVESFSETVKMVVALRPERIALYNFAYVPQMKRHQRKIILSDLPSAEVKLTIFLESRGKFVEAGYEPIAMDHFAVGHDELARAFQRGELYRNFMGYTVKPADEFVGFGLTAIGFLGEMFVQNHKTLPAYYRLLTDGHLPVERGKLLDEDDVIRQWTINCLMCQFKLDKAFFLKKFNKEFDRYFFEEHAHIIGCQQDHLIEASDRALEVTELGKIFIRNICVGFDRYYRQKKISQQFSRTV